jgi:hypothetical protein
MKSPLNKEAAYKAATTERPQLLLVGTSASGKERKIPSNSVYDPTRPTRPGSCSNQYTVGDTKERHRVFARQPAKTTLKTGG